MAHSLFKDPRLLKVKWKDLTQLTTKQVLAELTLSLPWLALSLGAAYFELYPLALLFSFILFLTGLRQAHNCYHYTVGISKAMTEWFLFAISIVMVGSMHAVKYNHLMHHKHHGEEGDIEGSSAYMSGWQALLYGPVFITKLHINAWKNARQSIRNWMIAEGLTIAIVYGLAFWFDIQVLQYHFIVMLIGENMTSFFAVWTVHHDCEKDDSIGRTIRGKFYAAITYNMFFHAEHHLFPKVPTCNLPDLAARLDEHIPEVKTKTVF